MQLHTNKVVPFENATNPTWQEFQVVLGQRRILLVPFETLDPQVQPRHTKLIPLVLDDGNFEVPEKLRL